MTLMRLIVIKYLNRLTALIYNITYCSRESDGQEDENGRCQMNPHLHRQKNRLFLGLHV